MKPQRYASIVIFSMLLLFRASAATLYVDMNSTNPVPPYADWSTAATNIQDAVNASSIGDLISVTNGVYQTGGQVAFASLTNRVAVTKAVTVQSVNGPGVTVIEGYRVPNVNQTNGYLAVRCAYLTNGAALIGFTLTNGSTWPHQGYYYDQVAAGLYCEIGALVSNCVIVGNFAFNAGGGAYQGNYFNCEIASNSASGYGGGAYGCTLNNCTLVGNQMYTINDVGGGGAYACTLNNCALIGNYAAVSATIGGYGGGGALSSTLNNCTLIGNSTASSGGGAINSTLNNCTVISNSAAWWGGGADSCNLNNCTVVGNFAGDYGGGVRYGTLNNCIVYYNTKPGPQTAPNYFGSTMNYCCSTPFPGGPGNITNEPLFVNMSSGDFHLQSNSPCINSGNNDYVTGAADLDSNPRIVGVTVDIGAYEYQTPTSVLSYAWAQQYGLPTDGSVDYADLDGTGMNNWQKWIAGLNPTNALSILAMLPPSPTNNPAGLIVSWDSVNNRTYFLQSSTNLGAPPAFSTIQSNIVGQADTTTYTDTTTTNSGPYFYRVGVQ